MRIDWESNAGDAGSTGALPPADDLLAGGLESPSEAAQEVPPRVLKRPAQAKANATGNAPEGAAGPAMKKPKAKAKAKGKAKGKSKQTAAAEGDGQQKPKQTQAAPSVLKNGDEGTDKGKSVWLKAQRDKGKLAKEPLKYKKKQKLEGSSYHKRNPIQLNDLEDIRIMP